MRAPTQILDAVTRASEKQLGDVGKTVFFLGDGLQRATVDGLSSLLSPRTWNPTNMLRMSWDAARQSRELSRFLIPGDVSRLAWQEVRNKLEVFILVRSLPTVLGLPAGEFVPLPDLVKKAYSLSAFQALWAVEGVGHYYADTYWERNGAPHGLLQPEQAGPVPDKSLLMLHAGIGLAFADRLLNTVTPQSSAREIRSVLEQFVGLCRNNSRPGYLGAAVESLGLVARDFYPEIVPAVNQHLQEVSPQFAGFFWHGVGRALYFSRAYFLPILRTAWGSIDREAGHGLGRTNVMAGLAWAVTLVNMRQPMIMENVLRSYIEQSSLADAFTNGVASSILMRQDTTPDEPFVWAFHEHRPADRTLAALWSKRIAGPVSEALHKYYPLLKQHHRLEEIFHYQLAAQVQELETIPELPQHTLAGRQAAFS
jgi:hypothetical protein